MFYLKPSEILYSQKGINNIFTGSHSHSGKHIGDTLDELADGCTTVGQIKRISVKNINGKWVTADNRRLWVFKNFEQLGGCTHIPVKETKYINPKKLNTRNGGTDVRIKEDPGGKWYNKLITDPGQYQNCLRSPFSDPNIKASSASIIDYSISKSPSYPQTNNNKECESTREDINVTHSFGFQSKSIFGCDEQGDVNTATLYKSSTSTPCTPLIGGQISSGTAENKDKTLNVTFLDQSFVKLGLNSTVSSSHSTKISSGMSLINYSEQVERPVLCTAQRSRTCSIENRTGTNIDSYPTLSFINAVQYQERTKDADLHKSFHNVGSPLPGTRAVTFEGLEQKSGTKLKPASQKVFTQLINLKQQKVNPKISVLMMLDPSEIRYSKDDIEYPLSEERWPTVHRRLFDLHDDENQKHLEAYKAYDMYWVKDENDILWVLKVHPDWKNIKLRVLVIEDNDAFLEFMWKEKPWLQISDILHIGQKIKIIK